MVSPVPRAHVRIMPGAFPRARVARGFDELPTIVLAYVAPVGAIDFPAKVDLLIKDARDRQRRRRASVALIVVAAAVVALAILDPGAWRGGGAGTRGDGHLAKFNDQRISFTYPARWLAQNKGAGLSLESSFVVALSTEHLRSPCRYSGNSGECGADLMLSHLGRNGVFLAWTVGGLAVVTSPTLEGRPGKLIQVGGKAARISVEHSAGGGPSAGGGCQPETTLTVRVETVNHYQLLACTDGNDAQFESDVLAMLRSVSFSAAAGRG